MSGADDLDAGAIAEAPENVRLVIGGSEYPCDVLRDPEQDQDGCAAWVVVPRGELPPYEAGMSVCASVFPARTLLVFNLGETP